MKNSSLGSRLHWFSLFFLIVSYISGVRAQESWPERSITLVIPFPPGAGADGTARLISEKLSAELSQKVVIENRPGADANIAIQHVSKSRPDGYTLLLANPTVVYNHLITSLDFDPLKALEPVAKLTQYNLVMLMSASKSPRSFQDFVIWAKGRPGGVNCGGGGGAPTIACHMLLHYGEIPLTAVAYKGNAQALQDLMGGHLDVMFDMSNSAAAQVGNSKVVALATTAEDHSESPFSELPILRKNMPGFKLTSWLGIFAPAGLPIPVQMRLSQAIEKTLADSDVSSRMISAGLTIRYENPNRFRRSLSEDRKHYERVFREIKMGK